VLSHTIDVAEHPPAGKLNVTGRPCIHFLEEVVMRAATYAVLLLLSLSLVLAGASRAQECIDYRDYPHLAARFDWDESAAGGMAVAGNHAYVAIVSNEGTGLRTIDISNPSAPAIVGEVNVLQAVQVSDGVAVAGSLAFMAVANAGMQIVDISDPEAPSVIGGIDTPGTAFDVAVDGTHAYIADGAMGLQVVDVSNPASPVLVGSFDTEEARGIVVAYNYAFIADDFISSGQSRLQVIDISNPVSPILAGSLVVPGQAEDVAVDGVHAYVACRAEGLLVVDISNPASPQPRGVFNNGGTTINVIAMEPHVYVGNTESVSIVNASNPNLPTLVTSVGGRSWRGIAVGGAYVYFTGDIPDFGVVDFSTFNSPPVIGQLAVSGSETVLAGDYAFLSGGGGFHDLQIVDISNPASPVLVGQVTGGAPDGLAVAGDHAYVIDEHDTRVYNVSTPSNPVLVGTADFSGHDIAVVGNYAFIVSDMTDLKVVDISNPPNFPLVAILHTVSSFRDMTVAGNYLYLVAPGARLTVVDISEPLAPLYVGEVDLGNGSPNDVTAAGSHVYVCQGTGFRVIDVSNPAAPTVVGFVPEFGTGSSAVVGDYAYVNVFFGGVSGLVILDVSVPAAPQSIGYVSRGGPVAATSTLVFTSGGGFTVLHAQCATTAAVSSQVSAPDVASMDMNFPNPFSGSTVIPYQLPAAAQVSLRIYDISGRMVRVLEENASRVRGRHLVSWNGHNAEGRPLPAGIYLCRLDAGGRSDTRRITLLK
jgi:hypothetical protein